MHYLLISGSRSEVINSGSPLVSGSYMYSKYLTFLDICFEANIFRYVNDGTEAVRFPFPFNIGRHTYRTLYVRFSQYF